MENMLTSITPHISAGPINLGHEATSLCNE